MIYMVTNATQNLKNVPTIIYTNIVINSCQDKIFILIFNKISCIFCRTPQYNGKKLNSKSIHDILKIYISEISICFGHAAALQNCVFTCVHYQLSNKTRLI